MDITEMRSLVINRAWVIYKNHKKMFPSFDIALKRAWEIEKLNLKYRKQEALIKEYKSNNPKGCHNWDNSERVFAYDKLKKR